MNDDQLLRYSRHILLNELGVEGQETLHRARVLLIGAGGLGSPVALYLAAAGTGQITICDGDQVDLSNLQRQIAHQTKSLDMNKALSAAASALALNPDTRVVPIAERLVEPRLSELVAESDAVIDASDNFATRHAINRACVRFDRPLVSGAAVRFDGQVTVFDRRLADAPCYHCLFPDTEQTEEMRCAENGVFSPLVGIIGSIQAAEAIKVITGIGVSLNNRLLLLNALTMEWRAVRLTRDPRCAVCGQA